METHLSASVGPILPAATLISGLLSWFSPLFFAEASPGPLPTTPSPRHSAPGAPVRPSVRPSVRSSPSGKRREKERTRTRARRCVRHRIAPRAKSAFSFPPSFLLSLSLSLSLDKFHSLRIPELPSLLHLPPRRRESSFSRRRL